MGKSKKPTTKKTRQKKIPPSVKKPEPGAPFNVWMDNYQIMQEFSVSSRTLYNWRKNDYIPYTKVGNKYFYNRTKFEVNMRKNSNPGAE